MTSANKINTLLFFLTFTLLNGLAQAQTTFDWDGSQNNNWDNGPNWTSTASGWPDDPTHNARFNSANYGTNDTDIDSRGGTFDVLNLQMGQASEPLEFFSSTSNPGMIRVHGNVNFNKNNAIDPGAHVFFTNLEVVNASTWTAGDSFELDIQGTLSGSGTLTATANAAGAGHTHSHWRGANTFSGTLIIDNVILDIEHRNAFEFADVVINHNDGFKIDSSLSNQTINIGSLSGTGLLDFKSNNFVTTTSADTTFSGTLQSTGDNASTRNFTKAGTGTLTLAGNITNFGTLFNTGGGDVEITSGGDWQRLEGNSGLIDIRNGANVTLESNATNVFFMNGGGNAFIRGGADVTLTGPATSRVVQTGASLINVNGAGSTLSAPRISVGPSGGGSSLFFSDEGAAVTVSDFQIGDLGADNGSTGFVGVNSSGTVDADLITLYLRGSLSVNGGQVTTDQLVVNGSTEVLKISDDTLGAALVIGGGGSSSTFNNVIQNNTGGAGSIRKEGVGTLSLGGNNTFSGGIILNGGTLRFSSDNAPGSGVITVLGSTIDYADSIVISNAIDLHNDGTLNGDTDLAVQFGVISETGGSFGITKTGAGSLMLAKANTFTGGTVIDGGTLLANNSTDSATGSGAVTVNSGGTLGGTGSVAGAVTVNAGGTIAPGNSLGLLTVGGIVFNIGSTFDVEIDGLVVGTDFDQLVVAGNATLDGTLDVSLGFAPSAGDLFSIIEGTINGTFDTINFSGAPLAPGLEWQVDYFANRVDLLVSLSGDFNGDGTVDAADYTVWRDGLGTTYTQADYNVWVNHFGATASSSTSSSSVPEPTTLLLTVLLLSVHVGRGRSLQ